MTRSIRQEALLLLEGRGAILDTAREVSALLRAQKIEGAVIGGIAVVLHGYVRTTVDIDVFTEQSQRLAAALEAHGFVFEADQRQFVKSGVPVHLVTIDEIKVPPRKLEERNGIRTVSLADLINMKLRTGTTDPLRAKDLADVIGLIEANRLSGDFAPRISGDLRPEFRKLVRAVQDRSAGGGHPSSARPPTG